MLAPVRGQTEQKSLIQVPGTNRANVSLMIQLQVTKKLEQTPQVLYVFGKVSGKLCAEVRSTDGGREVLEGKKATHPWTRSKKPPKPQSNKQKKAKEKNLGRNRFLNKVCQISKLFSFFRPLRADVMCLFS